MDHNKPNLFEKHSRITIILLLVFIFSLIYGLFSIKFINSKNLKTVIHQYYVSKIIDNNIGRFIKLREHKPNQTRLERPTRNYLKNIAPNSIERKYYKMNIDQNGFIMPSAIHAQPDLKIVFLGGSTTECQYIDEESRFPYVAGRLLERSLNKKINSYNGGVSANESMHSLNILMNKVLPMQPNIVVLMHNINDLAVLRSQGTYWYADSLKSHVQTAKNVFTEQQFPPVKHALTDNQMASEFAKNLETFIAICRIRDIKPVLMTQANRVDNDALYHRFNEVIREVGNKHQVLVIDLAKEIPGTPEYLYDHYHYTAAGSALAANVIALKIQASFNHCHK